MDLYTVLEQVLDLLQGHGRVAYRALKLQFALDDDHLEALKDELIYARRLACDEESRVLVWLGQVGPSAVSMAVSSALPAMQEPPSLPPAPPLPEPPTATAERRQLTVLFCDVVDSTHLASELDPEEWREVIQAYQTTCAQVVQRFEGHIAQYLGDGLLVYFGYPQAHEDDAVRAVWTGLEMVQAIGTLQTRVMQEQGLRLAVRIGIHTGLVVVGDIGGGGKREQLALGEVPNVAARLQGLAVPNTVVISATTQQLVQGLFTCETLRTPTLKGVARPLTVWQVLGASATQNRFEVAVSAGLTPLVGRAEEIGFLWRRWEQARDGHGQVVLLSGEAGIGKSRLVQELCERVEHEGTTRLTFQCSPYYQQSALYPVITHLQRVLQWPQEEAPAARLDKLEQALQAYRLPVSEVVPLFAALLSLPTPERYPPLHLSPQRQKQRTLEALLSWLVEDAERQPVLAVWEDLHWADPSTLELLGLLIAQAPTVRLLTLMTCRSEFRPPWSPRSHLMHLTLDRLGRRDVEDMITGVAAGKVLPAEVVQHIVAKTDSVPLFVEELTRTVLESGLVQEEAGAYALTGPLPPLAIPTTLQDSLTARLDRLSTAREVAQLGAALGREFTYVLLQAVAPLTAEALQHGLCRLVEAEILYQRGMPPHATYVFKHALLQDAAYQSLLKSTRRQYHQRIAQVLEAQFPETRETQPELLAQHYTEAGCNEQAVAYWQRAGQRALERSAYVEATSHLTMGLEVLTRLVDTRERRRQELGLQLTLALALHASKGQAAPEVERAYARARELCGQVEDTPQLFRALMGLYRFYGGRMQRQVAREVMEQLYSLAQHAQDPDLLLEAHMARGTLLLLLGELRPARGHLDQALALYDPQHHRTHAWRYSIDPGVISLSRASWTLWLLGYPDQALRRSQETLALARTLSHPHSLANGLYFAAMFHQFRREASAAYELAEATITLATEQGMAQWLAAGRFLQGWALLAQGRGEDGLAQMRQGLENYRATGTLLDLLWFLGVLAEACGNTGRVEEGLGLLAEAQGSTDATDFYAAELQRLKGELLLRQSVPDASQAEVCFQHALTVARSQQARSLELRTAMSLSRLWQRQGKRSEAYHLLAEVYGWFTEGFDTADLREAKALLAALS